MLYGNRCVCDVFTNLVIAQAFSFSQVQKRRHGGANEFRRIFQQFRQPPPHEEAVSFCDFTQALRLFGLSLSDEDAKSVAQRVSGSD